MLKSLLSRLKTGQSHTKTSIVSLHNDILHNILRQSVESAEKGSISTAENTGGNLNDGFRNFKASHSSWGESVGRAKKLTNYDTNLVLKMIDDCTANKIMNDEGLLNHASFQELVR